MDRRKFLRKSALASLGIAFGKGLELSGSANCKDNCVSIFLHGLMFYRFYTDSSLQEKLAILVPNVDGHCYLRGPVVGKDGSQLEKFELDTSFPFDGLAAGKTNDFPPEVPRFPLTHPQYDLGNFQLAGNYIKKWITGMPLPWKIVSLNNHRAGSWSFAGKVGQHIKIPTELAGTVCLQFKRGSGNLPEWLQSGKAHIYAQSPCAMDCNGRKQHLNNSLKSCTQLFTKPDDFQIAVDGECCEPGRCNSAPDAWDLDELKLPPVCQCSGQHETSPTKKSDQAILKDRTTGGPICAGFLVTPQ